MSQETRRQEILKTREENKNLAEKIELGVAYHESVEVYFTDRTKHSIEVHAISDGELLTACEKANANPMDLQKPEKFLDNLKLVMAIVEVSTRNPTLRDKLMVNEASKIAVKAFELMSPPKN